MPRMAEPVEPSQDRPVGPPSAVSPDSASAAPSAVPAAPSPVNQEAPAVPPAVSQGSAPAAPPAVSQGSAAAPRAAGAPPAASTEQPPPPKQAAVKKEEPAQEPASSAASELQSGLKREAPGDAPSSADSQGARRTSPRTPQAKEQLRARRQALLDELTAVDEELGVEEFASSHGLTLSSLTDEGHSLMHVAAEQLRLNQVTPAFFSQVVRAVPADMVDLLTVSGRPAGATALHMLAGSGRDHDLEKSQAIQVLLDARANLEKRDARGSTAFLRAAGVQSIRMLQTLAAARADVHARHSGTRRTAMDMANGEAGLLKLGALALSRKP